MFKSHAPLFFYDHNHSTFVYNIVGCWQRVTANESIFNQGGLGMNLIRVKDENGCKFAAALEENGFFAEYLGAGTASTCLHGGCEDPLCCFQHESYQNPHEWGSIKTSANGSQAHKIFEAIR